MSIPVSLERVSSKQRGPYDQGTNQDLKQRKTAEQRRRRKPVIVQEETKPPIFVQVQLKDLDCGPHARPCDSSPRSEPHWQSC